MSIFSPSRRQFLTNVGTGVTMISLGNSLIETTQASHPPYPVISDSVLEEHGWKQRQEDQEVKEGARWSIRTYEWVALRSHVREKTGGIVDIPLGGLIAMRIGNDGKTRRFRKREITDGETFAFPKLARWQLKDAIRGTYLLYLDDFSKIPFSNTGEIDWGLGPLLPPEVGAYTNICEDGGTIVSQVAGTIQPTQHFLEYELRDDTVNKKREVSLAGTESLDFFGWVGSWIHHEQIYVVIGVHPNDQEGLCGLTDPHMQKVLDEVIEGDVDLELDESLYGQTHAVMGAVR